MIYDLDNEYGGRIIGDAGEDSTDGVFKVTSASASIPAMSVGRTIAGTATEAAFQLLGSSIASGAAMGIGGGFVSCTSVILTSAAQIDYVIPVELNGVPRYIPVLKAAGVVGGAAF